jgi:hypothetical protein
LVVAAVGALVVFALGLIDVSAGLIAVGLAIGWAVGIAVRLGRPARPLRAGPRSSRDAPVDLGKNRRSAVAAVLGAAAIVVGFGLVWVWSRTEGGVLDPLAYLDDRYGLLLAVAVPVVAAVAAAARAR